MNREEELRLHRCCFAGPLTFSGRVDYMLAGFILDANIRMAIKSGYTTFITGMKQGTDLLAAKTVLEEKLSNDSIRLIAAVPYPGFEKNWSNEARALYREILDGADLVKYICSEYHPEAANLRKEWMLKHCSRLIAVTRTGHPATMDTIAEAKKLGIEVIT
ncbi:MAG: SLOG family protein [Clostridia bacterium]|nr:SLOG family protein [Clostridia bacterium]